MGRPTRLTASVALVALALVTAPVAGCASANGPTANTVGSPGPPPPTPASPALVYLVPMTQLAQRAVQPRDVSVFKDLDLNAMSWTSWTASEATGSGTVSVNPCDPSCADANYVTGPARVVLGEPRAGCGIVFYTSLTITWTDRPPPDQPRTSTVPIFDPVC
jgi:hypothetical protein